MKLFLQSSSDMSSRHGDMVDQAGVSIQNEQNVLTAKLREHREKERLRIVQLKKEGRYGRCVACGEDISAARMEANPAAERCLDCQVKIEPSKPQIIGFSGSRRRAQ